MNPVSRWDLHKRWREISGLLDIDLDLSLSNRRQKVEEQSDLAQIHRLIIIVNKTARTLHVSCAVSSINVRRLTANNGTTCDAEQ